MTEQDRGGGVGGAQALLQLLHEDLADDDVVLVAEARREDHGHPIRLGFNVAEKY